jgi:uncharacterized protein involved in outer membrane biogenesis
LQTTLLGIGLALIAAILAAFAAPLFIDWNEWRPELEAQASALAGTRVNITGNIDLTLLPTPAFVLRDVSLGDAEKGSGMRASEMRGSLSLTALLSGKIEADAFVVSRPAFRLVIERDGKFLLPAGASAGHEISVSGFVLEAGSLTIEDRRTNSLLAADDFSARGELVSREGPFRVDGGFRLNGQRWILRASSGRFGPDHSGKVRLSLERPSDSVFLDAEGTLGFADAAPRFEGKVIAAQRSGALPWRVSSDAVGDGSELRFSNLELALGSGELPITLSGEGKLVPRANGALELSLVSKRIDLDLGDQKAATIGAAHVLPMLSEAQRLLRALPLPAQISISADGILAGGQLLRDVRANLSAQNGAVSLERLEARLPGRAAIMLSGKNEKDKFSGPLSFEAEEPHIFARWLLGEELAAKLRWSSVLRLSGTLAYTANETSISGLQALIENTKVTGRLLVRDDVLQADLETEGANFDALLPAAKGALNSAGDLKFILNLRAANSRFLGKPLKTASIAVERLAKDFQIKGLVVDDLDGVSLQAKHAEGKGQELEFSAEVTRASGLLAVLEYLSGSADFGSIASKYVTSHLPLRISGTLAPQKNGWRVLAKSGDASLALDLGEMREARQPVEAMLRLPETEIDAKGEIRFGAERRFEPVLALNFKSADLRKAFRIADRASANAVPASGTTNLVRDGNNIVFDKLAFDLAGSRATGRIVFPAGDVSPFSGVLSFDRADAAALLSLALGRAHVSYVELGVPLLANFPGALKIQVGSLAISERISLRNAAFQIRSGRYETVFDEFQAQLAGGKVSGSLRVADVLPRVLEINLSVMDVTVAELLTTKAFRGTLRGTVALGANGGTEDDLVASLSGRGMLQVTNLEIDRTDATAVSSVMAATAQDAPDENKIEQMLIAALDRASLKVSKLEAPFVVANGIARSASAKAQAGNIEILLSGSLNIPKRSVEALLNIDVTGGSSVKPGATIRWSGQLDTPERKVDAKALITAITLRAIERGGRNPPSINLPLEERPAPAKKKRQPAKNDIESVPLLPPPANIPSAPQPRSQN